ncbi:unnamed protein product [Cylicostephanus goldi]|uniref:Uncharacterized protein n=1 Tax=Cylicostephanus goldi TaxID=71465 RepID=A0A3P7MQJ3_CYLGO|nr:unnamed protein product [Cylicostephanus goldi]
MSSTINGILAQREKDNQPYPAFDYAIVDCTHELIFNRTYLNQIDHSLDLQFYGSLENVRYHTNSSNPNPNYELRCPG